MSLATSKEDREVSVDGLERRLRELERSVCDTVDVSEFEKVTSGVSGLSLTLNQLFERFQKLEKDNDDIKEVFSKYDDYEALFEKEHKAKPLASTAEKKSILLSAYDDIRGMEVLLAEFDELKGELDRELPIKGMSYSISFDFCRSSNYKFLDISFVFILFDLCEQIYQQWKVK